VVIVVDGSNVRGTRPDGWWRDKEGAMHRLFDRLRCLQQHSGEQVVLVLDVPQPDLPEGDGQAVVIVNATRRGRDAADDRILEFLEDHPGEDIEVVTSDQALADAAMRPGVRVTGAGAFLRTLDDRGC
jgi:predicted RNA-binding protein with PIN domain